MKASEVTYVQLKDGRCQQIMPGQEIPEGPLVAGIVPESEAGHYDGTISETSGADVVAEAQAEVRTTDKPAPRGR